MPTERSSGHGLLTSSSNVIPFPTGTIAGDLLVLAWGSDFQRSSVPTGWTAMFNDYTSFFNGSLIWKITDAADITAGSVTLAMAGAGNGSYDIRCIQTGTFYTYAPVGVLGHVNKGSGQATLPQSLGTFTPQASSLAYYFASRNANNQTLTSSVGTLSWQNASATASNGYYNAGAMYQETISDRSSRTPSYSGSPTVSDGGGAAYIAYEVRAGYSGVDYDTEIAQSLQAWWKLDETSGTQAADSSGNARHATYDATAVLSQSTVRPNGPRAAKATAGPVAQISGASWMNVVPYTAVCWFRSVNTSDGGLFGRYGSGLNGGWLLWQRNGNWSAVARTAGSDNQLGLDTIVTSTNHMIAVTFDGTRMIGYLDGRPEGSLPTSSQAAPSGTDPIILGGYTFSNSLATMQDCSFHSAVLTPAQIYDIYKAG